MHSCIYEGIVSHCRHRPVEHRFQYRLFMVYLDLAEVPELVGRGRLISAGKRAARSFLRSDHLPGGGRSLDEEVRQLIRDRTGLAARGPIRLLTQLRYFGLYFSPLNLFFAYDESDQQLEFVVAEVSNTPWNQRHYYVLWSGNQSRSAEQLGFQHPKEFHVSPFMDMQLDYAWRLSVPGDRLSVRLETLENGEQLFYAGMQLQRRELSRATLRRMSFRYPVMTAQIVSAIYYEALKLWWKKCPFYPHPEKRRPTTIPAADSTRLLSRTPEQLS